MKIWQIRKPQSVVFPMLDRITGQKLRTVAEELIFPAATDLVSITVGKNTVKKLYDVPLLNNTICRRIEEMGVDSSNQLICRLRSNELAIQLDEEAFRGHDAYLMCLEM